jgi:hypothetical protein
MLEVAKAIQYLHSLSIVAYDSRMDGVCTPFISIEKNGMTYLVLRITFSLIALSMPKLHFRVYTYSISGRHLQNIEIYLANTLTMHLGTTYISSGAFVTGYVIRHYRLVAHRTLAL